MDHGRLGVQISNARAACSDVKHPVEHFGTKHEQNIETAQFLCVLYELFLSVCPFV